jgi:hypothetical protein
MTKKKKKNKRGRPPKQNSQLKLEVTGNWLDEDYMSMSTNMLAHIQVIDTRKAFIQEYGDDADVGDIILDTYVSTEHRKRGVYRSDAQIFHDALHKLVSNGLECAIDNLERQKDSKFKEGVSSVNASLFSALSDLIFLLYNFDVHTGILDVPSVEEGEMLIKKVALFSSMLEGFKRSSKTKETIDTLLIENKKLTKTHEKELKKREEELNAKIREGKDEIKRLEKRIFSLEDEGDINGEMQS